MRFSICLMCIALSFVVRQASAVEQIIQFHSEIEFESYSHIVVKESIRVNAEGKEIKHGIYRDFPTVYMDQNGRSSLVDFEVLTALRDSKPENFSVTRKLDGIRVYLGSSDRLIGAGEFLYELTYRTNPQLGAFGNRDRLYWNVTGNNWRLPILKASALVRLPPAIPNDAIHMEAFTGTLGDTGNDYQIRIDDDGGIEFQSEQMLSPGHGLTVSLSWPKGYLEEAATKNYLSIRSVDHLVAVYSAIGLTVVFSYFGFAWIRVGRDPEGKLLIPRYGPPLELSAPALRTVLNMGYDHKAFVAALIEFAIAGRINITESEGAFEISLVKAGIEDESIEKNTLLKALFGVSDRLSISDENAAIMQQALALHEKQISEEVGTSYYRHNKKWFHVGVICTTLVVVFPFLVLPVTVRVEIELFMSILVVALCSLFAIGIYEIARSIRASSYTSNTYTARIQLASISSYISSAIMLYYYFEGVNIYYFIFVLAVVLLNIVFYQLLKAPTALGRELMDKASGFAHFLTIADPDEMRSINSLSGRGKKPFEVLLPYVIACDLEQELGKKLFWNVGTLESSQVDYLPRWFRCSSGGFSNLGRFTFTLSKGLETAIVSLSPKPLQAVPLGGIGGAGSSGGGAGGSGGGGW